MAEGSALEILRSLGGFVRTKPLIHRGFKTLKSNIFSVLSCSSLQIVFERENYSLEDTRRVVREVEGATLEIS